MTKKIAVVGGGVIGASVAWHLAERSLGDVVLLERERLGAGTTWHSAGNITWKATADSDAPIAYMLDLVERLERETEQPTGWLYTGRLFLARSSDGMRILERYHHDSLACGVEGRLLEPRDVPAHHPLASAEALVGAWLNPRSGRLNPADLVAAYLKGARARGVRVVEGCAVERIDADTAGSVILATSSGQMRFDEVVACTGLWTRSLLARSGIALAHGALEHFYAIAEVTPALARETPSFICAENLIYGREEVGGFLVGFFDRGAKLVDVESLPEPFAFTLLGEDWDQVAAYYGAAAEIFPALTNAPIRRLVNGPESFTPDGIPLIGAVPQHQGLYVACAMNSGGVTFSGMAGHLVADLLAGERPRFQHADFSPARFGERGADPGWVDEQMPGAPSRFYLAHHQ